MLYIFHVDTGRMLTFDMNLALESVQILKETIERLHNLPVANQVLLISGGEILQSSSRVCSYSSGTDTNPIYMFITNFTDAKFVLQPWPSIEHQDIDFEKLVRHSLTLPATYNTVVSRALLAQQFYESARDEIKICEKLVYEQHLQQQGWAAVIANLEDLTNEFRQRFDDFCRCFEEFLEKKDSYLKLLECFDGDLEKLAIVPILPGLITGAQQEFHGFDEYLDENESFTLSVTGRNDNNVQRKSRSPQQPNDTQDLENSGGQKTKGLTLLQWITAKETHKSFEHVAANCLKQLQSFENDKMYNLRTQIQKTIENAEKEDVREIKGLKDRLQGLDKLMVEVKKKVQDQNELAIAFQQNQNRASNLGDASILPDLCETHSSQLHVMHKNHIDLRDIRRRISKAKEELGLNVMQRLKFIGHIENRMSELDNQMLFSHRCLRRFQRHLVIIEQIHYAPVVYVTAVNEVVRRRTFSTLFLEWASNLAIQLQQIHDDESLRRQEFDVLFEGHFLNSLFSGMDDMPPAYGNQAPPLFDSSLPNLTKDDLHILTNCLPDISSKIALPDLSTVINFFLVNSSNINKSNEKSSLSYEKPTESTNALRLIDMRSHLKDEFESETDTEEFEKVGQSPMERRQLSLLTSDANTLKPQTSQELCAGGKILTKSATTSTIVITTQSIETLTEENLCTTREEIDHLKALLKNMFDLSNSTIALLRQQLQSIKESNVEHRSTVEVQFEKIAETWDKIKDEMQIHEREVINRLTVDHELELNDIKKYLTIKNDEIDTLKNEKLTLVETVTKLTVEQENQMKTFQSSEDELKIQISELEKQLESLQLDKERALSELSANLIREHKTEIEALRCRFKLMTNMERSPSDTSLEKIERLDVIDLTAHDSILMQTREDLEYEREMAVKEAVQRERAKWEKCYAASPQKSPTVSQDLYKQILDEKECQLDKYREREDILTKENTKFKETIQHLTDVETSENVYFKNQMENLQKDKVKLEDELNVERTKRLEMESSFAADKSSASSTKTSSKLTSSSRSKSHSLQYHINIEGCSEGDIVVVVWDPEHGQYIIVQESPVLYFLHELSHKCLNLKYPKGDDFTPTKLHCVGRVVNKQYCYAKKDDNRYKVSKGTKFYRIRVVPILPIKYSESSRSSSRQERHDEQRSQCNRTSTSQLLIDSFAQTDCLTSSTIGGDRDMIDSGVVAQQKSSYKERNISVTEEDETSLVPQEQYRYISVSEEDESAEHNQGDEATGFTSQLLLPTDTSSAELDQDDSDEYRSLESKDGVEISSQTS